MLGARGSWMIDVARLTRSLVPKRVRTLLANCGGGNLRRARYAGALSEGPVDDERFLAICHSLIFPNGVRKTTSPSRNSATLTRLLESGVLPIGKDLDVLDVGASIGLDAASTLALLEARTTVRSYTLGDRYPSVLYDRRRDAVFDEDHHLLQVKGVLGFTSINFSYDEPAQTVINLPKRLRPWLISKRVHFEEHEDVVRIPLVHPSVSLDDDSPFRLQRIDAFEPIAGRYDLVVCMHLLVERYFSRETIARGEQNLANALRVGGALVVGASEAGKVYVRTSETDFDVRPYAFEQ
jgi:hypothetical protein